MPLPIVRPITADKARQAWQGDEKRRAEFMTLLLRMMKKENPHIRNFVTEFTNEFRGQPWISMASLYTCVVYQMLLIESNGSLPTVSPDVILPIRIEFDRNRARFIRENILSVTQTNPQIVFASNPLIFDRLLSGQAQAAHGIVLPGLIVYLLLERQSASKELEDEILPKLK